MKKLQLTLFVLLALTITAFSQKTYSFNETNSTFTWTGKKPLGKHYGTVNLISGEATLTNNTITAANFVIDMTSITVTDIPADDESNAYLTNHLKTGDFFTVEKYPTAKFVMTKAEGNTITGNLTIKDKTLPITFEVTINKASITGTMVVDRTKYGITYSSNSFFDNLGDKFINDEFTIDFVLNTK